MYTFMLDIVSTILYIYIIISFYLTAVATMVTALPIDISRYSNDILKNTIGGYGLYSLSLV